MISGVLLPHSESGKLNRNGLCLIQVQNICLKRQEASERLQPTAPTLTAAEAGVLPTPRTMTQHLQGRAERRLIWLASYPKSGNTWTRLFLQAYCHPDQDGLDINRIELSLHAGNRELFDRVIGLEASDLTPAEIERYRPAVYRQLALEADEPLFIKVHDCWRHNPDGDALFPADCTQVVIYLVRDPRAVAPSYAHHSGWSIDEAISRMADEAHDLCPQRDRLRSQLHQPLGSWSQHVLSWLDQTELLVHQVRYEDLMRAPEAEFAALIEAAGLPLDQERLNRALAQTHFELLQAQEATVGFKERLPKAQRFFRRGQAEGWRDELTEAQCQRIEADHGALMARLGYQPLQAVAFEPNSG